MARSRRYDGFVEVPGSGTQLRNPWQLLGLPVLAVGGWASFQVLQDVSLLDASSIDALAIVAFGMAVLALLGVIAVVTGIRCRALISETDAILVGRFGELVLDRRSVERFENGGTPDIGSMLVSLVERRPRRCAPSR